MINQKFNALTVVKQSGIVKHGRNNIKVWLCRCDCGELLEVDQTSLKKGIVPACKICRRGKCVICGGKITDPSFSVKRNTCSEACRKEQKRRKDRKYYAKLVSENPDYNKEYHQRRSENPDYNKNRYRNFRKRLDELSLEQRQAFMRKSNNYSTAWRKNWLERMKVENPGLYNQFLNKRRRAEINYRRKKQLAKLFLTEIKGKSNE